MNPAVIAAAIAGTIAIITLVVNGRRVRSDRQRELFGAAFGDVASYCEFPYIVRRRRHDLPEEERIRITTELSEVQRKLNHNRAVLRVEAPRVARAYTDLVEATRRIAGSAIHAGWTARTSRAAATARTRSTTTTSSAATWPASSTSSTTCASWASTRCT